MDVEPQAPGSPGGLSTSSKSRRPSPSQAIGDAASSCSGWDAIPKSEVDKCDYWINALDLQGIAEGSNFGRPYRQSKDLLAKNEKRTDTTLRAQMNRVKVSQWSVFLSAQEFPHPDPPSTMLAR